VLQLYRVNEADTAFQRVFHQLQFPQDTPKQDTVSTHPSPATRCARGLEPIEAFHPDHLTFARPATRDPCCRKDLAVAHPSHPVLESSTPEADVRSRIAVGGILALAFVAGCSAGVRSHAEVDSPHPVAARRESVRDVIVVERTHVPKGKAHGWWKKNGYREVTVYYDGARYYSRRIDGTSIRAVVVFQREGRYYLGDD